MINFTGDSLTVDDSSIKIDNGYSATFAGAKHEVNIFTTSSPILVRNCDIQCLTEDYNCNQDTTNFVECNTAPSMNYPFICASEADCSVDPETGMSCQCKINFIGNSLTEQCSVPPGNMRLIPK